MKKAIAGAFALALVAGLASPAVAVDFDPKAVTPATDCSQFSGNDISKCLYWKGEAAKKAEETKQAEAAKKATALNEAKAVVAEAQKRLDAAKGALAKFEKESDAQVLAIKKLDAKFKMNAAERALAAEKAKKTPDVAEVARLTKAFNDAKAVYTEAANAVASRDTLEKLYKDQVALAEKKLAEAKAAVDALTGAQKPAEEATETPKENTPKPEMPKVDTNKASKKGLPKTGA